MCADLAPSYVFSELIYNCHSLRHFAAASRRYPAEVYDPALLNILCIPYVIFMGGSVQSNWACEKT